MTNHIRALIVCIVTGVAVLSPASSEEPIRLPRLPKGELVEEQEPGVQLDAVRPRRVLNERGDDMPARASIRGERLSPPAPPEDPGAAALESLDDWLKEHLVFPTKPIESQPEWMNALRLPEKELGLKAEDFHLSDPMVLWYLDHYHQDPRILKGWMRTKPRFESLIRSAIDRYNAKLPPDQQLPYFLMYVAMIESGFNPRDRSYAGAVGLWQFLPSGAKNYDLTKGRELPKSITYWYDLRQDPVATTDAALRYLGDLKKHFGSWALALAAFNCGYGAMINNVIANNSNDYFFLRRIGNGMAKETSMYVPKALAVAIAMENPKLFGLDTITNPAADFLDHQLVTVTRSTTFKELAAELEVKAEDIAALNPELLRGRTPPPDVLGPSDNRTWTVRVPRTTKPVLVYTSTASYGLHRVIQGETLTSIAKKYKGATEFSLRALNGLKTGDSREAVVVAGTILIVPKAEFQPTTEEPQEPVVYGILPEQKDFSEPGKQRVFYRVVGGETPAPLAKIFGATKDDLFRWNPLLAHDAPLLPHLVLAFWVDDKFNTRSAVLLNPEKVIIVPFGTPSFYEVVQALRKRDPKDPDRGPRKLMVYTCKKGDSWELIAQENGLKRVANLARILIDRNLAEPPLIGEKIVLYVKITDEERDEILAKYLKPTPPQKPKPAPAVS